jgi:hypothetical protein
MLGGVGALVRSSGFLYALLTASGFSLLAVLIARGAARSAALGLAVIVAAFVGLAAEDVLPGALIVAAFLLAVAALLARGRSFAVRAAALCPGGLMLVTLAAHGTPGWARVLVFGTVIFASPTSEIVDRRFPSLIFALIAFSSLGVYFTVPDTEQARGLVGAFLPVAAVALVSRRSSESVGPSVSVAFVAWVGLVGGVARPGSVVGAVGCLGVLALGPLAKRTTLVRLAAVHAVVVVVASRVAGLRESAWTAVAIVVPVMVLAALVLVAGERGRRARSP